MVWELTLRCDLACRHCGSRAGHPRAAELSLDDALGVLNQLAEMGTREIAFIGGEAYLWTRWLELVRAAADRGIRPTMTSGARQLTATVAQAAADAGMQAISVSVDGLEATHDRLRNVAGSHRAALAALGHIGAAGMDPYANTQFNRLNLPEVEPLGDQLIDAGIKAWQVQLTGPMGRAADRPEWLLQPYQLLDLFPRLAAVAERARARGVTVDASNNLGYYGPYEGLLRRSYWKGCAAGRYTLGIEANGDVKGCPSLPSEPYVGGNLRESSLAEVWRTEQLAFTRKRGTEELWGFCGGCYYADVCRGGCSWTAHTLLGRRGNMPYCHHRTLELDAIGRRERLIKVEDAPGRPFDFGRFELVEEDVPTEADPQTAIGS
ncbi:MAG: radical SAM protein with 4Fe4S-binding SPASM domain [Myxococcota bacterium]